MPGGAAPIFFSWADLLPFWCQGWLSPLPGAKVAGAKGKLKAGITGLPLGSAELSASSVAVVSGVASVVWSGEGLEVMTIHGEPEESRGAVYLSGMLGAGKGHVRQAAVLSQNLFTIFWVIARQGIATGLRLLPALKRYGLPPSRLARHPAHFSGLGLCLGRSCAT